MPILPSSRQVGGAVLALIAGASLVNAQSITTTAGPSLMTAASTMKLAKSYSGNNFFDGFNFETADDPTGGYVNYVSRSSAEADGLISVQSDGAAIMRVNSELRASGRGRDSVRLSSKDEFADGVYILDLNHMPVGCGVWPAWWTVVKNGWPTGGEIDIVEGANTLPTRFGAAWNATGNITTPISQRINRNTGSLHTNSNCTINPNPYMTGQIDKTTCSAFVDGNTGCGAIMPGNTTYGVESFGSQVNGAGGGWYAMWRDMEVSGGVYIYFWPRNSPNVPEDVRNPNTATTNTAGWGQPGANLTASSCRQDFANHVIVFNMAFCGDYTAATFGTSGCPTSTSCSVFVMNNPKAFAETYWSINSLRVYNKNGVPTSGSGRVLTTPQIVGIAVGGAGAFILLILAIWRYRVLKKRRAAVLTVSSTETLDDDKPRNDWAAPDELPPTTGPYIPEPNERKPSLMLATAKPRTGRTTLAPGKTARHHLDGETAAGFYHEQQASLSNTPNGSTLAVNALPYAPPVPIIDRRLSAVKIVDGGSRLTSGAVSGLGTAPVRSAEPLVSPRKSSTYSRPSERKLSVAPSFSSGTSPLEKKDGTFAGEKTGGSWVG